MVSSHESQLPFPLPREPQVSFHDLGAAGNNIACLDLDATTKSSLYDVQHSVWFPSARCMIFFPQDERHKAWKVRHRSCLRHALAWGLCQRRASKGEHIKGIEVASIYIRSHWTSSRQKRLLMGVEHVSCRVKDAGTCLTCTLPFIVNCYSA